jgi:hypothetical protein
MLPCKNVGFMIHKLKSFSCKTYAIFFFLWSSGGPNWRREVALWCDEQEAEWTYVGAKSNKKKLCRDRQNSSNPQQTGIYSSQISF